MEKSIKYRVAVLERRLDDYMETSQVADEYTHPTDCDCNYCENELNDFRLKHMRGEYFPLSKPDDLVTKQTSLPKADGLSERDVTMFGAGMRCVEYKAISGFSIIDYMKTSAQNAPPSDDSDLLHAAHLDGFSEGEAKGKAELEAAKSSVVFWDAAAKETKEGLRQAIVTIEAMGKVADRHRAEIDSNQTVLDAYAKVIDKQSTELSVAYGRMEDLWKALREESDAHYIYFAFDYFDSNGKAIRGGEQDG